MENLVGIRFKKVRKVLNKSQQDLAESLGITKQAISNIETSKSLPSISVLSELATKYKINLNYLVAGMEDIFIKNDESYKSLRDSLMEEVESFLKTRGI